MQQVFLVARRACIFDFLLKFNGGYVDVHGVQGDGGLVFLRRINTKQDIENTPEGEGISGPNQHDGSAVTLAATGLSDFVAIRLTNQSGRFHMSGMSFTSNKLVGSEGTGLVHWGQLQGIPTTFNGSITGNAATATSATRLVGHQLPNTDGSGSYIYLGRWNNAPQSGSKLRIQVVAASGYNASIGQNAVTDLYFKTSNGSSVQSGSTGSFFADAVAWRHGDNSASPTVIRIVQVDSNTYDFYGSFGSYTGEGSFYSPQIVQGQWVNSSTVVSAPNGNFIDITPRLWLDSSNYNSYSPTLTGTGASGNWGINASTAYGLNVHTGRNNEANKVVRTDGNGYLLTGYINCSNGNENNNSNADRVWGTNGSDDYMRTYRTSALSVGYASNSQKINPLSGDANYKLCYTADGQRTNPGEWGRAVMRYEPNGQTYGIRVDRADYADSAGGTIGTGQTWQDVKTTPGRVQGTTYTNSTGRPITVSISFNAINGANTLTVSGVAVARAGVTPGNGSACLTAIIPNGATYSVDGSNGIALWAELR